ncbi:rhodanese-like domain-containing protein [Lactovum odontotermitis]
MYWIINVLLILFLIVVILYPRFRPRMVAKILDNKEFNQKISENAQLIDVRDSKEFRVKHIMGARNLPYSQIEQSLSAFSKDKDILLYENGRPQYATRVAGKLKKAGFKNVFILRNGLSKWGGKVKSN